MMTAPIKIVVAVDEEFGIGKEGGLPWDLPADLKHFRQVTTNTSSPDKKNAVVMGRKTWESIPEKFRPLPKRINFVLSRNQNLQLSKGVYLKNSLNDALQSIHDDLADSVENIFIIGGAQIFSEAADHPLCQAIFLTQINKNFDCDVSFPHDLTKFKLKSKSPIFNERGISFYFAEYVRV